MCSLAFCFGEPKMVSPPALRPPPIRLSYSRPCVDAASFTELPTHLPAAAHAARRRPSRRLGRPMGWLPGLSMATPRFCACMSSPAPSAYLLYNSRNSTKIRGRLNDGDARRPLRFKSSTLYATTTTAPFRRRPPRIRLVGLITLSPAFVSPRTPRPRQTITRSLTPVLCQVTGARQREARNQRPSGVALRPR